MRIHDAISGLLLAILAIAVIIAVRSYPPIPGQSIGPSAFPMVIGVLLLACSGLLIWRGMRSGPAPLIQLGAWMKSPVHAINFLLVVGGLLFYIFASNWLGFIPTSLIILSVLFYCLHVRLTLILPVAVLVTLVIHTAFYKLLRVPLPWGVLQGMAW